MPTPKEGESRKDFMSRCIPIVKGEGSDAKEAAGKCGGIYDSAKRSASYNDILSIVSHDWIMGPGSWEGNFPGSYPLHVYEKDLIIGYSGRYYKIPFKVAKGKDTTFGDAVEVEANYRKMEVRRLVHSPIRAAGKGSPYVYRAYGVLYGDQDHKDMYGTWFDAKTKYHLDWYDRRPWLYDHGQNAFIGRDAIGSWEEWGEDDVGIFFTGELDKRSKYVGAIQALIDEEVLYPSQGTARHLMHVEDSGYVTEWGLVEISSTTGPGNLHQRPVSLAATRAFRLLGGIDMSDELEVNPTEEEEVIPTEEEVETEEVAEEQEPVPTLNADEVVAAIRAMDATLQELHSTVGNLQQELQEMQQSRAQEVRNVIAGRQSLTDLWSVTRQGNDIVSEDELPAPPPQMQHQAHGSILSAIAGQ